MKTKIYILLLMLFAPKLSAQITLEECWAKARANYPQTARYLLIDRAKEYDLENASRAWLPQFSLSARATYQSDVTSVPIPGVTKQSKDQYQIIAEASQTIWDGGLVKSQRQSITTATEVDKRRLDVDLYALNERVNNLFFGILLLEQQIEANRLFSEELNRNQEKVISYIASGIANQSDLDAIKVEILNNNQQLISLQHSRTAYCDMLSLMICEKVDNLVTPPINDSINNTIIKRLELNLFDAQVAQVESQRSGIVAKNSPRIGAFIQGAYGNPGLNMLKAGFTPYAIGGVRLSWNFGGLYTRKNEIAKIQNQQQNIYNQRETFLFNTQISTTNLVEEIQRIRALMVDDSQIIELRHAIILASEAKVAGGTMSVLDMLREATQEQQAIRAKLLHEVQLIQAIYNLKYITNN